MATACHLLDGQPARGTEMATTRWKNSVNELRGVYRAQGTIYGYRRPNLSWVTFSHVTEHRRYDELYD